MASSYNGPYDHDCGWLECTILSCPKVRRDASEETLRWANIDRAGKSLGLPECGDLMPRHTSLRCKKAKGHPYKHAADICDWPQRVTA